MPLGAEPRGRTRGSNSTASNCEPGCGRAAYRNGPPPRTAAYKNGRLQERLASDKGCLQERPPPRTDGHEKGCRREPRAGREGRVRCASVRIAALDLGSNSFHLLVADVQSDGTFEPLARDKE